MTLGAFIPSCSTTHVAVGGDKKQYPSGRFTGFALLPCLVTMLAALIIGHHIGVSEDIDEELNDLLEANRVILESRQTWKTIFTKRYSPYLVMALAIPFFQQFTGINVIMFYGPIISKSLGMGANASLIVSVITGAVILLGTIFGVAIADKVRRKHLFVVGGFLMFICEVVAGYEHGGKSISTVHCYCLLALLAVYLVGFACSWGVLGWLVPSEIFPLEIRLMGHCIMVGVSMFSTFIIAQYSLGMFCKFKFLIFYFFAALYFGHDSFCDLLLARNEGHNNSRNAQGLEATLVLEKVLLR
ncbi:Sugar transport protein [Thalictrum thalictroides]|uniref:Sugar transport protein n=1 Tax=Thalictrum thalictroides TaxID=46969 RepID=A0A7J6X7P4_THATH|nr:Sugar transport protein [Thalictrum thalictroides]